MPFVKREIPPEAKETLELLAKAAAVREQLEDALADQRSLCDDLARKASSQGATRRDVAKAGRITAGRVQQLLT